MDTEPTPDQKPPLIKVALPELDRPAKRVHLPNVFAWLFVSFVVLMLVGIALPVFNSVALKSPQTRALAQAKTIGLALKLFATDHDGKYPRQGIPEEMTVTPTDSNTAFACLFPVYTGSESIFGNKQSAYQTAPADNVIDTPYTGTPKETLQPGENVYSYVMGLTDSGNPALPLIADGTDGTGHYNCDPTKRGGVWKGKKAIVIRTDLSGLLETLAGSDDARFVPKPKPEVGSIFDFSRTGKDLRLLDPAVGPHRH